MKVSKTVKAFFEALIKRKHWDPIVIHSRRLTKLPSFITLPLLCGHVRGKLKCPSNLTILLIHNYRKEHILEKSLRYVGIENFVVLKAESKGHWSSTVKLLELKKFLQSDKCKTEYILYLDSDDTVLRDDPEKAIKLLQEVNCDFLLSKTTSVRGYGYMPQIRILADQIARENGYEELYPNAGVFIGKASFLEQVVNASLEYVTENDLSITEQRELRDKGTLLEKLPSYPKGCGSDQQILRYLHPRFYPRMNIDYRGRLAIRR